jgi:hypothetical protein
MMFVTPAEIIVGAEGPADVLGSSGFGECCTSWEGGVAGEGRGLPLVTMAPDRPPEQNLPLEPRACFRGDEEGTGMAPGCESWGSDVISTSCLDHGTSSSSIQGEPGRASTRA